MSTLQYNIDSDRRLVVITGDYSNPADWLMLAGRLLKDPRITPGLFYLRDLRGGSRPASTTTVLAIFRVVQRFWPSVMPSKGAIVTDRGHDSAAQVAQALADSDNLPIQVFTSYDTAVEWLLDEKTAPALG